MISIFFVGNKEPLAAKLKDCCSKLNRDINFKEKVSFVRRKKENWNDDIHPELSTLLFYELTESESKEEYKSINAIKKAYPNWQWVLLVEPNIDYFEIAKKYYIGNILIKDRFDFAIIRALTVRLITRSIFGFSPYFPAGYSFGPLEKVVYGKWVVSELMSFLEKECLPLIPDEESHYRIRTYFYELLINTISYSIVGITPKERDEGKLSVPSEIYIPPEKPFKISMVMDKEKCGFSFLDNSGSLSLERVLDKFRRHSRIGVEQYPPGIMDITGRGLTLIHKDNRLVVNIMQKALTEIIFLHYNKKSLNKYESIIITEIHSH